MAHVSQQRRLNCEFDKLVTLLCPLTDKERRLSSGVAPCFPSSFLFLLYCRGVFYLLHGSNKLLNFSYAESVLRDTLSSLLDVGSCHHCLLFLDIYLSFCLRFYCYEAYCFLGVKLSVFLSNTLVRSFFFFLLYNLLVRTICSVPLFCPHSHTLDIHAISKNFVVIFACRQFFYRG